MPSVLSQRLLLPVPKGHFAQVAPKTPIRLLISHLMFSYLLWAFIVSSQPEEPLCWHGIRNCTCPCFHVET